MIISNQKPNIDAVLNDQHEHSKGLQASYLFNQKGEKVFDYTKNKNELSVVNASYVADGLQFDANGEYTLLDNTNQIVNSEAGTIVMWFKSLSAINDSVIRGLFGYRQVAVLALGDFSLYKHPSNHDLYFLLRDGSGVHYISIANSNLSDWQSGVCIAMQWDRSAIIHNNKMEILVCGEYITPNSTFNQNSWNMYTISNDFYIGNTHPTDAIVSNGIISQVNIYNTVLSESTLKSIKKKPYDNFYF